MLLLLSLIPVMTSIGSISGQTYTTMTNALTLTTQITNTQVNSVTTGSVVTTSTEQQSESLYSGSFSLPAAAQYCGYYSYTPFNGAVGQVLSVSLTADNRVDIYLMSSQSYAAYSQRGGVDDTCRPTVSTIITKEGTTSSNFTIMLQNDDKYYLIVNNISKSLGVNANLNMAFVSASTATLTTQLYATSSATIISTFTQTSTSLQVQAIQPAPSIGSSLPILVVAIIIIVGGILAYRLLRGKKEVEAGRSCEKCGAQLPPNAKFCKKCGTSTPQT